MITKDQFDEATTIKIHMDRLLFWEKEIQELPSEGYPLEMMRDRIERCHERLLELTGNERGFLIQEGSMNESKLLRYFGGDRSLADPLERVVKQMIESGTKAKTVGQEKILVNRSNRKNQYYVVVRIKEHHPVVSLVGLREVM